LFTGKAATKKVPIALLARLKRMLPGVPVPGIRILSSDANLVDDAGTRPLRRGRSRNSDHRDATPRRFFAAVAADGAGL
jgi:hypothetical protein